MNKDAKGVLRAGLLAALTDQPPRALGIRSHAISTEDHADALISALAKLLTNHEVHAVIGRPSGPTGVSTVERVEVLDTHSAAARATALRNNNELGGRRLLYFNTESSPGEAGLDGLDELTPQALALGYAKTARLTVLESLANDERRLIVDRIEDATVDQLAAYSAAAERFGSELYALPILGLLPLKMSEGSRVESLLRYTGTTLANQLDRASLVLSSLDSTDQSEVESALQEGAYVGLDHRRTLKEVLLLCGALARFARGLLDINLDQLCGLNSRLLRLLRSGDRIRMRLTGPTSDIGPAESGNRRSVTEPQLLERDGVSAFGADILEVNEELTEVCLDTNAQDSEACYVRAPRTSRFALSAVRGAWGEKAIQGCALRVSNGATLLRGLPVDATVAYELSNEELAAEPDTIQQAITNFRSSRRDLLSEIEGLCSSLPQDERAGIEMYGGLGLLECFPIIVVQRLRARCSEYVEEYARVVAAVAESERRPSLPVEEWLLHLDVAFAAEQRVVSAARLLPLHPLRIARYLAWSASEIRPPAVPSTLVVTYGANETLHPSDVDGCYQRNMSVGPSEAGVSLAARTGLQQLWALLSPEGLVTSLDIELCDIENPVEAVHSIAATAQDLYESDRRVGNWVTLVIHVSSRDDSKSVPVRELREQLGPEFETMLNMPAGEGLRLELHAASAANAQFRHLIIEGVETPYRNLAADEIGLATGAFEVEYVPNSSGGIGRIEVRGDEGVEAYRGLLESLHCSNRPAREPGIRSPELGDTLMRTIVCQGGWPARPEARADLLAYGRVDDDVFMTLADPVALTDVTKRQLHDVLRVPRDEVDGALREIQAASLALYPCRDFLVNLMRTQDDRHLRAGRAILKAFGYAQRSLRGGAKSLVISLDTQEGLQWAKAAGFAIGRSATRADLLIIEADAELSKVERIRVAELKASESARNLESQLVGFAKQPLTTRDRLVRIFGESRATDRELESFRRLVWLGAGHQYLARDWENVLRDIDVRVRSGQSVDIQPECWLVPDGEWPGESEFHKEINWTNDLDQEEVVTVQYNVIARPPELQPAEIGVDSDPVATPSEQGESSAQETPALQPEPSAGTPSSPTEESGGERDAAATPSQSKDVTPGISVCVGRLATSEEQRVYWYPNDTEAVTHFNVGITGTMGTGKTQLVKSLIAQLVWGANANVSQQRPGLLVFDYKGDYGADSADGFARSIGAQILTPEHLPLNPLHLVEPQSRIDFELHAREFADTLVSIGRRIGEVQRDEIIRGIRGCLAEAGIDPQVRETWQRSFPTLTDLLAHLRDHDLGKGTPQAIIGDLVDLEVFAPADPGAVAEDLLNDITVIDLRRLAAAPNVIKIVIACFMNAFYASMVRLGEAPLETRDVDGGAVSLRQLRRLLLVDEADDFMALNLQSLKNTMQQGRSFGCGVILSTQFLKHFEGSDAPLRQLIGTWVMHRMADVKPRDVQGLLGVSLADAREFAKKLTRLSKHKAVTLGVSAGQHGRQPMWIDGLPFYQLPTRSE